MELTLKMIGEVQFYMYCMSDIIACSRYHPDAAIGDRQKRIDRGMQERLERIEDYLIRRYNELPQRWQK